MAGDGAQNEGHLPHAQYVQRGRHQEMSDRGVLGPGVRASGRQRSSY